VNILSNNGHSGTSASSWDDKPLGAEEISFRQLYVTPELTSFYNFSLLAGEMLTDADTDSLVLLNETAVKAFGWHDPVGKHFEGYTVKGVIKNIYNLAPTIQVNPVFYSKRPPPNPNRIIGVKADGGYFYESDRSNMRLPRTTTVVFKYREGMWKSCKEKIVALVNKEYANATRKNIRNFDDYYEQFLKSENALIKLLSFVSAICIFICVFGFVSLVSLTCEERRKSIAIRKIIGATSGDIISIFSKEYSLLLLAGVAIAFSTGYFIMQRWLEHYVKQTSIPAWIYLSIMCVLALVIVLCVGWQVYRASIENPAEVVKSE
jgi:ABC-type antimicrobial peptide transport system permease subunit